MSARLPAPWGRLIDREQPVRFSFEGETVDGYVGDTVGSALLARGTWLLQGRSLQVPPPARAVHAHRRRSPNTLVQLPDGAELPAGEHVPRAT
ncbi:MAG: 2Fe-2S iron-sulfur cluster-binding protein [Halofilum sp. (in: g-proteobacteria)]|nr:2Fe-2S iron-sulfur cluster-binding protein [Halofilum sp. (in: g-proteobacteria)]